MILYRLSRKKYKDTLTGIGAEMGGGRWNSKGIRMVYTSPSRALCMAEIAVHTPLGAVPDDYYLVTIEVPDAAPKTEVLLKDMPPGWKSFPESMITKKMGDNFIKEDKYLVMTVPSAVVQGDYNFLLNPFHEDYPKVKILSVEPFEFDERLFR